MDYVSLVKLKQISELKKIGIETLKKAKIPSFVLDAEVLLAYAVGVSRENLVFILNREISEDEQQKYLELIERRKKFEPVSYLLGKKEFYGRDFVVNPSVLIPRPETELLVEKTLSQIFIYREQIKDFEDQNAKIELLEIGTGSGIIPITIALELRKIDFEFSKIRIVATDCSSEALEVATENAKIHKVDSVIEFVHCNLLDKVELLDTEIRILVSNPPYISLVENLEKDVSEYEPHLALFSGASGLEVIEEMIGLWVSRLTCCNKMKNSAMLLEVGYGQASSVESCLKNLGIDQINIYQDLQGISRVVEAVCKNISVSQADKN
jgi:release factor glutamine methyltransferase